MRYIPKISTGKLGFEKADIRKLCEKAPARLFKIRALITDVKYGTHNENGDWTKFLGQIEATNLQTGEIVRSGELFLPGAVTPIVESQVIQSKGLKDEAGKILPFTGIVIKLEVGAIYDKKSATEYIYTTKNLIDDTETDFLSKMRDDEDIKFLAATNKKTLAKA